MILNVDIFVALLFVDCSVQKAQVLHCISCIWPLALLYLIN